MSSRSRTSKRMPLAGVRVLVGRARHQAGILSKELRSLGASVIEIPFIEIRKPRSFQPMDTALKQLNDYDWLILTSVNGVEALWERLEKLRLAHPVPTRTSKNREWHDFSGAPSINLSAAFAAEGRRLHIAAIGPATKKAIEDRGMKVDIVPKDYVAESVVRSLRRRVKGKRVLLLRAKVARDVIPRELRAAGARVDVVEAYETVVPETSRRKLAALFKSPRQSPQVITFTSSSTVKNLVELLGGSRAACQMLHVVGRQACPPRTIQFASIGPVTSATLREKRLPVDAEADEYTIPGLTHAIVAMVAAGKMDRET